MRLPFFVFRAGRAVTGRAHTRGWALMGLLSVLLGMAGCDPQRIAELEEGVATEADVRARFGRCRGDRAQRSQPLKSDVKNGCSPYRILADSYHFQSSSTFARKPERAMTARGWAFRPEITSRPPRSTMALCS